VGRLPSDPLPEARTIVIDQVNALAAGLGVGCAACLALAAQQWRTRRGVLSRLDDARAALARTERAAALEAERAREKHLGELAAVKRQNTALRDQGKRLLAELAHLVERRLPAVADQVRGVPEVTVPGPVHREAEGTEIAVYLDAAEQRVREAATAVREQVAGSARAGVRAVAEELQAQVARAQRDIDRAMDNQPSNVVRLLTPLDHSITMAGHSAQRLRVLCDSWPGAQRADCTVAEIMDGARGRILHYEKIEYTYVPSTGDVWVQGRVVEPLIMAVAELLDNATAYSGDTVVVFAEYVAGGLRIVVEDLGLGMNAFQREEAESALAEGGSLDVTRLADERKLGFRVIGRLAATYGLRVGLSPSASGGVRAALLVPHGLLVDETVEPFSAAAAYDDSGFADSVLVPAARYAAVAVASSPPAAAAPVLSAGPASSALPASSSDRAAASASSLGLPKRQPRVPQAARFRPSQEAVTEQGDPEVLAAEFDRLRIALQEGYTSNGFTNGG
jgi:hypothetical protein